jgi:hypothetical protein
LHKAAGGEARHAPKYWAKLQQTIELIDELKSTVGIPTVEQNQTLDVINGGVNRGTYAVKELVYAYATWISAKFFLTVIRAYDSLVSPKRNGLVELESVNKTQWGILSAMVADISIASGKEGATKTALWSRFSNHFKIGGYKELPAIKFDDAVAYLDEKRAEYDKGFTLAVVKKDDLLALGYDTDTKMFAVKALPAPSGFTPKAAPPNYLTAMTIRIPIQSIESVINELGGMILFKEELDKIKGVLKA